MNTELTSRLAQTTAVYIYDFYTFTVIYSHVTGLFGTSMMTCSHLLAQRDGAEGELTDN